jgi:hypothetical protein
VQIDKKFEKIKKIKDQEKERQINLNSEYETCRLTEKYAL